MSTAKAKRVRVSCSLPPMVAVYVEHLLHRGTFGDTRTEVVRNLICAAVMEALDGETIRALVEKHKGPQ